MLKRTSLLIAITASTLIACGSVSNETSSTSGGTTTSSGQGGAGAGSGGGAVTSTGSTGSGGASQGYTVTFDPVTVASGEEHTRCIIKRLHNPTAMHVGQIHNVLGEGSHHLIVYKTTDTMEQLTPFDCQPFTDLGHPEKGSPLMVTQKKDDTLTLPDGVAFAIDQDQMVRLEMHYINTTGGPLDVTAKSTFIPMDESKFKDEAGFLFGGDPDISVPAHGTQTLGPTYLPLPAQLAGVNFFGFTGHTHQWGTKVTVATTTGKMGADTSVYDVPNWSWSEPATVYFDPAIQVPQGGGFHLTCEWNNASNSTVSFGESANAEMCFFWTYYYPDKGALVCLHTEKVPGGADICCPGNPFCSKIFP